MHDINDFSDIDETDALDMASSFSIYYYTNQQML